MTLRTNQPGSALASLSAFWEQSMQNGAMDLRRMKLWTARLFLFLRWHLSCLPSSFLSIDTLDADSSGGPGFCLYQAAIAPTLPYHASPRTYFSGFGGPVKKNGDPSHPKKTKGGSSPHLHSHSMEELSCSLIRTTTNPNILQIDI